MRRSTRLTKKSEPKKSSPKKKKSRPLLDDADGESSESSENLTTPLASRIRRKIKKSEKKSNSIVSPKLFGKCEQITVSIADSKFKAECDAEEEKTEKVPNPGKLVDIVSNLDEGIDVVICDDNSSSEICNTQQHEDGDVAVICDDNSSTEICDTQQHEDGDLTEECIVENISRANADIDGVPEITETHCEDIVDEVIEIESDVVGNIQNDETIEQDTVAEDKENLEVSVVTTDSVNHEQSTKINENVEEVASVKDNDLAIQSIDLPQENDGVVNTSNTVGELSLKYGSYLTRYENVNFDKFAGNPLMETLLKLKQSFPFKEYLQINCSAEKNIPDSSTSDILSLDSVAFVNETPASKNTPKLSSQVHVPVNPKLYFDKSSIDSRKVDLDKDVEKLMKKSVLPDDLEKMGKAPKLFVSKNFEKAESKRKQEETAGKGWYNLPKTEITDKIKKDLQLLKMRSSLDSKQHYKRNDSNKFPKYFQMGTVVEGAHEFYSGRIPKSARKRTMVDELLDDAEFRRKNKKKYIEICKKQMSGSKGFYKKQKNKKKATWERT